MFGYIRRGSETRPSVYSSVTLPANPAPSTSNDSGAGYHNGSLHFVQVKQAIFYRFGHLPRFHSRYFERCPGGEFPFKQAKVELKDITDICLIYCI